MFTSFYFLWYSRGRRWILPCQGQLGANQSFIWDCRKFGHSPSWWKWFAEIDISLQSWFVVSWLRVSAKYWLEAKLNFLGESTGRKWKIPISTCKFSHDAAQNLSSFKFNQFSRKIPILHFIWNISPLCFALFTNNQWFRISTRLLSRGVQHEYDKGHIIRSHYIVTLYCHYLELWSIGVTSTGWINTFQHGLSSHSSYRRM